MCYLRCFVASYGKEKIIDLVNYRREQELLKATGTEDAVPVRKKLRMSDFLNDRHDNDLVYIEKLQASIPYGSIKKAIAIRERINNI